ncbi:MAG: hypothetical protein JKY61_11695 [Planctomycetes bacterium]|nr:hypothetical protein [Planctomycetota bacterium]
MEQEQQGNGKKWAMGCCGGLILFMLLLGGGGYYGANWAKDTAATAMREGIAKTLEDSELSEEQSTSINAEMERLESALQSWGLIETVKHMGNLEHVQTEMGTIGFHAILLSYGQYVLPHTAMPEEERQAGRRIIQRFARGVDEGTLSLNQNDKAWKLDGKSKNGEPVEFDVEEVRSHLAQLKAQVDAAEIPDEAYEVDLANKLRTIVDTLLAE